MANETFITKYGGRKFVFSCGIAFGLFLLALIGRIEYEQLVSGLLWTLGIFSASNVGQKLSGVK